MTGMPVHMATICDILFGHPELFTTLLVVPAVLSSSPMRSRSFCSWSWKKPPIRNFFGAGMALSFCPEWFQLLLHGVL